MLIQIIITTSRLAIPASFCYWISRYHLHSTSSQLLFSISPSLSAVATLEEWRIGRCGAAIYKCSNISKSKNSTDVVSYSTTMWRFCVSFVRILSNEDIFWVPVTLRLTLIRNLQHSNLRALMILLVHVYELYYYFLPLYHRIIITQTVSLFNWSLMFFWSVLLPASYLCSNHLNES